MIDVWISRTHTKVACKSQHWGGRDRFPGASLLVRLARMGEFWVQQEILPGSQGNTIKEDI